MADSAVVLVGAAAGGRPPHNVARLQPLWLVVGLITLAALAIAVLALPRQDVPPAANAERATQTYAKLPLSFVPNEGQVDGSVRYYAQGGGFGFYFTDRKAVLSFQGEEQGHALHLRFRGASPNATLAPQRRGEGTVNYVRGDDPSKWQTDLPTYRQLAYQGLWPGIDMRFRGAAGKLKYEFALAPGAKAERIRLAYAGAEVLSVSSSGALLIKTRNGTLRDSKPRAWQQIDGRRVPVRSRYAVTGNSYGFALGAYDRSRPLVIDPGIVYSTYLGGPGTDITNGIAVDGAGSAYVTGRANTGFPTTAGAFDTTQNGSDDAFVAKLNPAGSALSYSTFLGGTGAEETTAIAVDGAGNAYVTGETTSTNFPTTAGAYDTISAGGDAFVTKLNPSGSALDYSTFLGGTGNDHGHVIAVDSSGGAYVAGFTVSSNFPTTPGAFDTTNGGFFDAFVTKLNAAGSALDYSTFLGGGDSDSVNGIAIDGTGTAYVTGGTRSAGFPTTGGAYDTTHNGIDDAFVTRLNATGTALLYSTFLGGTDTDGGSAITLDSSGNAYVTGATYSANFPTTAGVFDSSYADDADAFVAKLNAAGSALAYSTFLGDIGYDAGSGIALDPVGTAYVTGRTDSVLFPTTGGAYDTTHNGVGDVFVTGVNTAASALWYSTFVGGTNADVGEGIVVVGTTNVYVAGYTTSSDYPTSAGAFDTGSNGGFDAFATKLELPQVSAYPVPTGGASFRVQLVPAFDECTQAEKNSLHGGNLASDDACSNPQPRSSTATVGTSTTLGTRLGFASVDVCSPPLPATGVCSAGSLGGPAPDVRLRGNGSDIVCKAGASPTACPGGAGSDYDPSPAPGPYSGNLSPGTDSNAQIPTPICNPNPPNPSSCAVGADMTAQANIPDNEGSAGDVIRITDRFNTLPSTGDSAICSVSQSCSATVLDNPFTVPVVCAANASPSLGSYCGVNTTANALVPGVVVSGKNAVVEIGQFQVFDSGPDGVRSSTDDELFAVQGIYIP